MSLRGDRNGRFVEQPHGGCQSVSCPVVGEVGTAERVACQKGGSRRGSTIAQVRTNATRAMVRMDGLASFIYLVFVFCCGPLVEAVRDIVDTSDVGWVWR